MSTKLNCDHLMMHESQIDDISIKLDKKWIYGDYCCFNSISAQLLNGAVRQY